MVGISRWYIKLPFPHLPTNFHLKESWICCIRHLTSVQMTGNTSWTCSLSYLSPSTCSQPTPSITLKLKARTHTQTEVIIPAPCLCCTSLLLLPQQQDCSPQLLPRKHWAPRITTASPGSYTCVVTLPNTPHNHQGLPRTETAKKTPHMNKGRLMIDTKTEWLEERGLGAF